MCGSWPTLPPNPPAPPRAWPARRFRLGGGGGRARTSAFGRRERKACGASMMRHRRITQHFRLSERRTCVLRWTTVRYQSEVHTQQERRSTKKQLRHSRASTRIMWGGDNRVCDAGASRACTRSERRRLLHSSAPCCSVKWCTPPSGPTTCSHGHTCPASGQMNERHASGQIFRPSIFREMGHVHCHCACEAFRVTKAHFFR